MVKSGLSEQGLSLIELLTTITISAIILVIMGKFLADFHASREVAKVMMEIQEQAQFALDYMTYGSLSPGDTYRKEGLIWASQCNVDSSKKKISFQGSDSKSPWIFYEEKENRLRKYSDPPEPNNTDRKDIIPYLDGSQEYRKGPFEVSVQFEKPGKSVLIEVTVRKDGLSSTLKSVVTPRNRSVNK